MIFSWSFGPGFRPEIGDIDEADEDYEDDEDDEGDEDELIKVIPWSRDKTYPVIKVIQWLKGYQVIKVI